MFCYSQELRRPVGKLEALESAGNALEHWPSELLGLDEGVFCIETSFSVTRTFTPGEPLSCVTIDRFGGQSGLNGINWFLKKLFTWHL